MELKIKQPYIQPLVDKEDSIPDDPRWTVVTTYGHLEGKYCVDCGAKDSTWVEDMGSCDDDSEPVYCLKCGTDEVSSTLRTAAGQPSNSVTLPEIYLEIMAKDDYDREQRSREFYAKYIEKYLVSQDMKMFSGITDAVRGVDPLPPQGDKLKVPKLSEQDPPKGRHNG